MCVSDIAGLGLPLLTVLIFGEVAWWVILWLWLYVAFLSQEMNILVYLVSLAVFARIFYLQYSD